MPCPICKNVSDELAEYIKELRAQLVESRQIARKLFYKIHDSSRPDLSHEELDKIGIHYGAS